MYRNNKTEVNIDPTTTGQSILSRANESVTNKDEVSALASTLIYHFNYCSKLKKNFRYHQERHQIKNNNSSLCELHDGPPDRV